MQISCLGGHSCCSVYNMLLQKIKRLNIYCCSSFNKTQCYIWIHLLLHWVPHMLHFLKLGEFTRSHAHIIVLWVSVLSTQKWIGSNFITTCIVQPVKWNIENYLPGGEKPRIPLTLKGLDCPFQPIFQSTIIHPLTAVFHCIWNGFTHPMSFTSN